MADITNIPAPRVPLIDDRTGLMSREWFRFFVNLFNLVGAGTNSISLVDVQVGPDVRDYSADINSASDYAQLMSMPVVNQYFDDYSLIPVQVAKEQEEQFNLPAQQIQQESELNPVSGHQYLANLVDVSAFNPSSYWPILFNSTTNKWTAQNDHSVIEVTTSQQLDHSGYIAYVTVDALTVTLPAASTEIIGLEWTVLLGIAGSVTIQPDGTDVIILPTTDTTVSLYQEGDSVTFQCLDATTWGLV